MRRGIPARRPGAGPRIPRADGAAYGVQNPGFAAPSVPRADGAAYGVENPGFAVLAREPGSVSAIGPLDPEIVFEAFRE
jgi:hypothetical protein